MIQDAIGTRVELHRRGGIWIEGDRYGEIVKVGRKYYHEGFALQYYHVMMDKSGRTLRVSGLRLTCV